MICLSATFYLFAGSLVTVSPNTTKKIRVASILFYSLQKLLVFPLSVAVNRFRMYKVGDAVALPTSQLRASAMLLRMQEIKKYGVWVSSSDTVKTGRFESLKTFCQSRWSFVWVTARCRLVTDVSGQRVSPFFKGQDVPQEGGFQVHSVENLSVLFMRELRLMMMMMMMWTGLASHWRDAVSAVMSRRANVKCVQFSAVRSVCCLLKDCPSLSWLKKPVQLIWLLGNLDAEHRTDTLSRSVAKTPSLGNKIVNLLIVYWTSGSMRETINAHTVLV